MDMKIEHVYSEFLKPENQVGGDHIPVVRLTAVDTILREAVWAMKVVRSWSVTHALDINHASSIEHPDVQATLQDDDGYKRAKAFLASRDVAEWREREEKK